MRPIINITCLKCTTPLLAFTPTSPGVIQMTSYGCAVSFDENNEARAFALCQKCGYETPFERALLGTSANP